MEIQNNTHVKTINGVEYRDLGENLLAYYNASPQPEVYLVKGDVKVTFAQGGEVVTPIEDNADPQIAQAGDVIIQNPSDEGSYIYRYGKGTADERRNHFLGAYQAHPTQSGIFIDQGCRAVKFTTENIVGEASYGGPTSTEAGGAMVLDGDGVYTIALKSVTMDYRHATLEEIKSRRPEAQVSEISDGIFSTIQKTLQK
jgi:hypothetical protein